ncbi:hypothetical protein SAMN05216188_11874 [Lentzea xinjiangensis]|uniref:Uncharacterized protein n=1 Tax=Lentzea xinjiangensis TaxID=402600 RepID=A0A1H9TE57_9PSEU|nr:hypothetical protein [Lentzea xinjiangensis]SER95610.1 hypothetical protein SAMN05216188_11874 [Lentzea xinjiangensis]
MSETQALLDAATEAMGPPRAIEPEQFEVTAAAVTAAVLRALSALVDDAENAGIEWPDSGDLSLLADAIDPPAEGDGGR